MERRGILAFLLGAGALVPAARAAEPAASRHRVAIQVSSNDAATMNLAMNNATNAAEFFASKGESAAVEIVAYGPGLHMLRDDTSPVKPRIAALKEKLPGLILSACANTKRGMEKSEGHAITLIPQATVVPAGVVRLMELQEQGWSYIRP